MNCLISPAMALTPDFVRLWVGVERYGGDLLTVWTAGYVWVSTLVSLWGWPIITTGKLRVLLPSLMVGTVLNVGVSIACTIWFGVAGPAIGSSVTFALVYAWWLPVILRLEFGTPLRPLARAVAGPVLVALPLAAGVFSFVAAFPIQELAIPVWARWLVLAGQMVSAVLIYSLLAWFLVLTLEDRKELRARLFRQ